jgi:hypothetical protein
MQADTVGQRGRFASVLAVTSIAVVVLLVGTAAAAPVVARATRITYGPPYSGVAGATTSSTSAGCTTVVNFVVLPFFNLTNGVGKGSVKVAADACLGANNASVLATESTGFAGDSFTIATSGKYHLKVTDAFDYAVSLEANALNGGSAYAAYGVGLGIDYLKDLTNGTSFGGTSTSVVSFSITSGTYNKVLTPHLSGYLNATLKKGHTYLIGVGFEIEVVAYASIGTSNALASVNMARGGGHSTMLSIVLS